MARSRREAELVVRRAALRARASEERQRLVASAQSFGPAFGMLDRAVVAAGWASRHALVIAGVAAVVIAVRRPSRLIQYAGRAWTVWRLYQDYRERIEGMLARIEQRHRRL